MPVVGNDAINFLLGEWLPRWQDPRRTGVDTSKWDMAGQTLPPHTLQALKEVLKTYPVRLGLGMDQLHPRSLLMLPDSMLLRLLDLFALWEDKPQALQEFLTLICFLAKPEGGVRPIGLTICLLRVWSRLRSPVARQWEAANDSQVFWGKGTQSCERAGWVHNVLASYANRKGLDTATFIADLEKFYEHVGHEELYQEAQATGFNLVLLRALCTLYGGLRAIIFDGACSEAIKVEGTILAGCSCATSLAKLLLLRLLKRVDAQFPLVHIRNVVDDVSAQACGTRAQVSTQLGLATEALLEGFGKLHLPVSKKKTLYMANSQDLSEELGKLWSLTKGARRQAVRLLGTDATMARSRATKVSKARKTIAKKQCGRLAMISDAGVRAHLVFRAGVTTKVIWGSSVTGMPPAELHGWRVAALKMHGRLQKGICTLLKLRGSRIGRRYDPGPLHHGHLAYHYSLAVWEGIPTLGLLGDCLEASICKMAGVKAPWRQASDPIDAVVLTLSQLGWKPLSPRLWRDDRGGQWDLLATPPKLLRRLIQEGSQRQTDNLAIAKAEATWCGPICWEAFGGRLDKCCGDWSPHHQRALRSVMANAHWPQARLFAHCRVTDPLCRLCQGAPGTLWHRRFECPATEPLRRQHLSDRVRRYAAHARGKGQADGELFARALFPAVEDLFPRMALEEVGLIQWHNRPASGRMSGNLFLDGSGRFPQIPCLRRAGWAVVQVDDAGQLISAAFGPVPFDKGPFQQARDGEDYAAYMCLLVAMGPMHIFSDCAGTVGCLSGNPKASSGVANERAHLWGPFWGAFEHGDLQVSKTLAHASIADVERGATTHWERNANNLADQFAKRGAMAHQVPVDSIWIYRGLMLIGREVASWAGRQEVHSAKEESFDTEGIAGTSHLQFMEPDEDFFEGPVASGGGGGHQDSMVRRAIRSKSSAHDLKACGTCVGGPPADPEVVRRANGHLISVADLTKGPAGRVFACLTCGAYAWKGWRGLLEECKGPTAPGYKEQRSRLAKGFFPHNLHGEWRIGAFYRPEGLDLEFLTKKLQLTGAEQTSAVPRLFKAPGYLQRSQILSGFGLQEDDLQELIRWAKIVQQSRLQQSATPEEGVPEDEEWEEIP